MIGPNASGATLRLSTTNRSCPTVSPLQTLEVEQIAVAEFGLSEDIITENAGRGIADTASLETALAYARRLVAAQIKTKEGVV